MFLASGTQVDISTLLWFVGMIVTVSIGFGTIIRASVRDRENLLNEIRKGESEIHTRINKLIEERYVTQKDINALTGIFQNSIMELGRRIDEALEKAYANRNPKD